MSPNKLIVVLRPSQVNNYWICELSWIMLRYKLKYA